MSKTTLLLDRYPGASTTTGDTQSGVKESGTITIDSIPANGDTITLGDNINGTAAEFEFTTDGSFTSAFGVDIAGLTTIRQVSRALAMEVNRRTDSECLWDATLSDPVNEDEVTLTHRRSGDPGALTWSESASNFTFVQPSGGTGAFGALGASVLPQTIRDQTGYLILGQSGGTLTAGTVVVEGRADADCPWVQILTCAVGTGADWQDGLIGLGTDSGGVSLGFPLMPEMRFNVTVSFAGASTETSLWLLE